MTDRDKGDMSGPPAPPDPGERAAPEPPPAPAAPLTPPPNAPWERQQPPPGTGPYPGRSAGSNAQTANRPASPAGAHRTEPPADRPGQPEDRTPERTEPAQPPPGDDATQVYPRLNLAPPQMREEAPGRAGTRYVPPQPARQIRPSGGDAPAQWSAQRQPDHAEAATARPPEPARWTDQRPSGSTPTASSTNWSYVDAIRTSELVPTRKTPPYRGWRRTIYKGTFGLINLGQSPDERRLAELEDKTRSLLRGRYKIGVLGKGGTGKTTIAAGIGSIFAEMRQDDRVVAIDADTAFGKLGSRIDPNARGSYWELAADEYLHTFADVRSRVGNNAAGLFVLAGESATARRRVLDPAIYREATSRLDNHFTISLVDCGSTLDSAVTQEALRDLDALIVVSSPWVDGASAAGQTMEWLANNGYTGLLHRTVVVLNDSDGHADKRTRQVLMEQFGSRGQVVVEVPYDPHLRPGGVIDVQNEVAKTTRRRLIEIAASIAEHFAATTDGSREHR